VRALHRRRGAGVEMAFQNWINAQEENYIDAPTLVEMPKGMTDTYYNGNYYTEGSEIRYYTYNCWEQWL
jgi:hypothetical protein